MLELCMIIHSISLMFLSVWVVLYFIFVNYVKNQCIFVGNCYIAICLWVGDWVYLYFYLYVKLWNCLTLCDVSLHWMCPSCSAFVLYCLNLFIYNWIWMKQKNGRQQTCTWNINIEHKSVIWLYREHVWWK